MSCVCGKSDFKSISDRMQMTAYGISGVAVCLKRMSAVEDGADLELYELGGLLSAVDVLSMDLQRDLESAERIVLDHNSAGPGR